MEKWMLRFGLVIAISFSLPAFSTPQIQTGTYDVIVIGAGGGGLSAAAALSWAGKKVLVIERHSKVGGYMTNFQRGPYSFEVSLHALDGLDPEGKWARPGPWSISP